MSPALIAGCVWVVVGAITAMMPMRRQIWLGIPLLLSAPVILGWIGYRHGWIWTIIGLLAFASMMRNPLRYLIARMRGERPEIPKDFQQ